ncbi:hypothetical protein UFOVP331_186 [uncultured Caudovirales phage]|uniref:Uncharacterized protein n=1 Tax=uncultured Caudovirales phage TaxID=2100421 RepID=A0A6J5M0J1_9CAUD|nr:hypothetical protein UFOVP331_186 [uncultured Caudovirales phage]
MTKDELKEKIKILVKQAYKPASSNSIDDVDVDTDIDVNIPPKVEKFPIFQNFPPLKDAVETLLTSDYEPFITDIQWVSPKPLTFRVILANDEIFYLIYSPKSWIAQIEGKKYYLLNIGEEEAACESLSRMLYYGGKAVEEPEEGESIKIPEEPAAETPAEVPGEEETPAEA